MHTLRGLRRGASLGLAATGEDGTVGLVAVDVAAAFFEGLQEIKSKTTKQPTRRRIRTNGTNFGRYF